MLTETTIPNKREVRNLALAGFMGTGKTSVGHLLANLLQYSFVDTDEMIEQQAGKKISEIFAQDGEARFRQYEREVVAELAKMSRTVISTGGGLTVNPDNMASLKTHALVICLWASPEVILARVGHQNHRPLLQGPAPLEKIRELLAQRKPFYRGADVLVGSDMRTPREVAQHVALQYRLAAGA